MKRQALEVRMGWTTQPDLTRRLAISAARKAAMEPVTPRRTTGGDGVGGWGPGW